MTHKSMKVLSLVVCICISYISPAVSHPGSRHTVHQDVIPDTVVIDGYRLRQNIARIEKRDRTLTSALDDLLKEAGGWLTQGPWTVTSKTQEPPNGTYHDYASQAPYWWPSDTPDGCPYVQRDGERNPEVDTRYPDHSARANMFRSSYVLSLAWYYTHEARYARRASLVLHTWFLNPTTAMSPNLQHAQIIPCKNDGRAIGIIDFSQEYTNVLDAVAILSSTNAPGWTESDQRKFIHWNRQFLDWLVTSPFGVEESTEENNHGTFAQMQIAALALFTGNHALVREASQVGRRLIDSQITSNGSQPNELERTRSWHYSNFNLGAHLRLALIAKKVGVDLFRHHGPDGQSLFAATNFLLEAAVQGQDGWPFEELDFKEYAATDNIQAAADAGDITAKKALARLTAPPTGNIYPLRPAPEQLDNIAG